MWVCKKIFSRSSWIRPDHLLWLWCSTQSSLYSGSVDFPASGPLWWRSISGSDLDSDWISILNSSRSGSDLDYLRIWISSGSGLALDLDLILIWIIFQNWCWRCQNRPVADGGGASTGRGFSSVLHFIKILFFKVYLMENEWNKLDSEKEIVFGLMSERVMCSDSVLLPIPLSSFTFEQTFHPHQKCAQT